jgi:predicted amidophosphoribosyltransferase
LKSKHIKTETKEFQIQSIYFRVMKCEKLDQKIIIIDDVTTTGSTLKEARDELLKAGYVNVTALSIAH